MVPPCSYSAPRLWDWMSLNWLSLHFVRLSRLVVRCFFRGFLNSGYRSCLMNMTLLVSKLNGGLPFSQGCSDLASLRRGPNGVLFCRSTTSHMPIFLYKTQPQMPASGPQRCSLRCSSRDYPRPSSPKGVTASNPCAPLAYARSPGRWGALDS